jgi:hypothetical protein
MKKKIFLIIFFLFLPFFPFFLEAGLVPCGTEDDPSTEIDESQPCQLCHFFVLFKNIIDFLLFKIVPVLAILMLVIGGLMFILAYLSPGEVLPTGEKGGPKLLIQAKKLINSVIFGLIIIFAGWLIVNTFFQIIGVAEWTGLENWWQIPCP